MTGFKYELFAVMLFLFCACASAINKCTGIDGKLVFQDTPCHGRGEVLNVKPAAGLALPPAIAASGAKTVSEAQRIEALVLTSQKERRRRDLETIETLQAAGALDMRRVAVSKTKKTSRPNNTSTARTFTAKRTRRRLPVRWRQRRQDVI